MFVDAIDSEGFAIIPEQVEQSAVSDALRVLTNRDHDSGRAGTRHILRIPEIFELANSGPLVSVAKELLGAQAFPFSATYFDKQSEANWHVSWHQDRALPVEREVEAPGWGPWSKKEGVLHALAPASVLQNVLALRVHLDDSTEENGPIRFLPGTHKLGILSDHQIQEISLRTRPVAATVPRCCIVAMRPLIVHSSLKMRGDHPRRVIHIQYAASTDLGSGIRLATA